MKSHLDDLKLEMQHEVNEFYKRFSELVNEHREAHLKERRKFLKRRGSLNFYPVIPISFRKLADN